jgi:hypothetical protein
MPNKNMKYYLKIEKSLADDNYKLIEKIEYFEALNVNGN